MSITKKILLMLSAIFLTTVFAVGFYISSAYSFSLDELSKTFKDYRNGDSTDTNLEENEPFSILLMGVDTGSGDRTETWEGNSDSMMLVTINPDTATTTVTSLERDILVKLKGSSDNAANGQEAKLNAAYANGGAEMAISTVEELLDIEIDKYMQINMEGLVQLVDAVGGITVTNEFDFPISIAEPEPEYTATVDPGTHKINGDQALVYSRMRYDDPDGDYGRQRRQREVIQKILEKLLALDGISNYKAILSAVSGNMQTDIEITSSTIPYLLGYREALENVKMYQLRGEDAMIDGGSYQLTTAEHLLKVQNRIKKALGKKTSETLKTSAVLYEVFTGEGSDLIATSSSNSSEKSIPEEEFETEIVMDTEIYNEPVYEVPQQIYEEPVYNQDYNQYNNITNYDYNASYGY